jgi:catechol 2,3-dioxygenase-like lactoylglutathione lyase family enzyme
MLMWGSIDIFDIGLKDFLLSHASVRTTVVSMLQLDPQKPAVDFGITIRDWDDTKGFYCDLLGLPHVMDMPMPVSGAGTMHRVQAGNTTLKFVEFNEPSRIHVPGGPGAALGIRYLTIWVRNLLDAVETCRAAGHRIALEPTTVRAGVLITMIEDPDGNWVELLQNDPQ